MPDTKHDDDIQPPDENDINGSKSNAQKADERATRSTSRDLTSIVILTINQLEHTRRCLESIRKSTSLRNEVIVVDNGSTDGTVEFLRSQPSIKLICNSANRGFPAAANQGVRESQGSYVLLLNNDVIVTSNWLESLQYPFSVDSEIGLVGPRSNNVSGSQWIETHYQTLDGIEAFATQIHREHKGQMEFVDRLVGFCMLVRRQVFDRVGLLDERFGIGNFEDDDFCRRAIMAGFRAVIAKDAFVHHVGSASFRGNKINLSELLHRNRSIFDHKWNGPSLAISLDLESDKRSQNSELTKAGVEMKRAPLISLCMIVRDSSRTLPACLQSIRHWVDEIIVVDTGSHDDSIEIAKGFGATVYEFPWCDSFSLARNESIRHAKCRWIFWMDSDDTIDEENGRKLRTLIEDEPSPSVLGFVLQVHCPSTNEESRQRTNVAVDHIKLFRNIPAIRFSGRIHEQVLSAIRNLGGDVIRTQIHVVHSGSDQSIEGVKRKHARDLRLLDLELLDDPDHTFALFNMGMTLVDMGEHERALGYLCRSLQLATTGDSHTRKVYALLVQCYAALRRPHTAIKTCLQGLAVCQNDPELVFRRGVLEQTLGNLAAAEQAYLHVQTLRDLDHFSSVDRGIFDQKAWHNLAVLYESQGRFQEALLYWRKMVQNDPDNDVAWRSLVALSANNVNELRRIRDYVNNNDSLRAIVGIVEAHLAVADGSGQSTDEMLESAIAQRDSDYQLLQVLCHIAFERGNFDLAERGLRELINRNPQNETAFFNLALVYFRRKEYGRATAAVSQSLSLRPGYASARSLLEAINRNQSIPLESVQQRI